jgi:hypothetical protein
VGPRAVLDAAQMRKFTCPCLELNPIHPAHNPSLYRLSYPSSSFCSLGLEFCPRLLLINKLENINYLYKPIPKFVICSDLNTAYLSTVFKHPVALIYLFVNMYFHLKCNSLSSHHFSSLLIYTHKPFNNITSLATWKNLQPNGADITRPIITLHRHPYELHK